MSSAEPTTQNPTDRVTELLDQGTLGDVRGMLLRMASADVAHLLESSPPRYRHLLWQLLDESCQAEVLSELGEELKLGFLSNMQPSEVAQLTGQLDDDDVADILQQLPDQVTSEVLDAMDAQDRARLEQVMLYPDDSAGGLMNTDTITVRADLSLDVVLRYLRRHDSIPDMTDSLIVVTRDDRYLGLLPLPVLLVSDPERSVRDTMDTARQPLAVDTPDDEVARLFERNDWVSAPVVDASGRLLGRITIDDVVDVIREDADHSLMSMAGLDEEEDTFAPVMKTARRRSVWLGINLITALAASSVINLFQGTIEKVVALAVLMPIVASMGGIAGTQTITILVRALAMDQISRRNRGWLIRRELLVGLANGLTWALVVATAAALWFDDVLLGAIIAGAMVINLVTAGIAGATLPLALDRLRIDPALAGGVLVTTVTDVIGFFAFLGMATYFYA